MAKTEVRGAQIKDTTVGRSDLNTSTNGEAVVRRIIAGTGVTLGSTGADSGTGDVTINASAAATKPCLNFPASQANGGTPTTVNNHSLVAFSGNIYFEGYLPSNYGGGGLTVEIFWAVDSDGDTAHTTGFDVYFERCVPTTTRFDVDDFASQQSVSNLSWTSTLKIIRKATVTFTNSQIDSLAAGEAFRLRVLRTGSMTGNILVSNVIVRET